MATRYEAKVVEQNKPSLRHNEKLSRGSASVSFQPKLSFYSVSGSGSEYHNDGEGKCIHYRNLTSVHIQIVWYCTIDSVLICVRTYIQDDSLYKSQIDQLELGHILNNYTVKLILKKCTRIHYTCILDTYLLLWPPFLNTFHCILLYVCFLWCLFFTFILLSPPSFSLYSLLFFSFIFSFIRQWWWSGNRGVCRWEVSLVEMAHRRQESKTRISCPCSC